MDQRKYTFVTVAPQQDWDVLRLQARSMHLYLPQDLVAEIIVVENPGGPSAEEFRDKLRPEYANLASKVRFLFAGEIADIPENTEGWFSQQVLKFTVSNAVATDRYVVLDTKNHLVFPLERSFLESGNKISSWPTNYEKHPLRPYLERSLRYFGLEPAKYIKAFLPTITPFTLPTQMVCDLIRFITEREQRPFPVAFLDHGFADFLLFESYLTALGKAEEIYDLSVNRSVTIWDENAIRGAGNLKRHIERVEKNAMPFFAVHRHAVPWLDDKSRRVIAEFWQRRHLVPAVSDGIRLLSAGAQPKPPRMPRSYLAWKGRFLGLHSRIRRHLAQSG